LAAVLAIPGAAAAAEPDLIARGEYLYRAAGCSNCHTDRDAKGAELAGGAALTTPFGVFYAPNITPDREHGIGSWSDEDFVRAMREGVSPRGSHYYPAFPYTSYTKLTDEDLRALKAYLFTLPPVAQPDRPHELPWYVRLRPLLYFWKWLYFEPGPYRPDPQRSAAWNRGAYLANAVAHCGECHTPRDRFGGLDPARRFAGTTDGPDGAVVPNITPDRKTGIGRWSERDIAYYLETGMTPDGDFAGDVMADVIDNGLRHLTDEDRRAIATYLKSLPPIEHAVRKPKKGEKKKRDEFEY